MKLWKAKQWKANCGERNRDVMGLLHFSKLWQDWFGQFLLDLSVFLGSKGPQKSLLWHFRWYHLHLHVLTMLILYYLVGSTWLQFLHLSIYQGSCLWYRNVFIYIWSVMRKVRAEGNIKISQSGKVHFSSSCFFWKNERQCPFSSLPFYAQLFTKEKIAVENSLVLIL